MIGNRPDRERRLAISTVQEKALGSPEQSAVAEVDPRRIVDDPAYRTRYARVLLDRSGAATDHVELRRLARRVFPDLARARSGAPLAQLIGSAATMLVAERDDTTLDVPEQGLITKPSEPLDYPASYSDLDGDSRTLLIRFCETELGAGREGREALQNLDRYYGWPYSDRTFYVGPWKAARLRRRKQDAD